MFEPIHGSAFEITGKGIANPVASFWTAAQMLDHLGEADASARLMRAVERVCAAGIITPDVGGTATTKDVTDAVVDAIYSSNPTQGDEFIALVDQKPRAIINHKAKQFPREADTKMKQPPANTFAFAIALTSTAAFAQGYPTKPITMLVPFAAGGSTDTVARVTAQSMGKLLGQTIIVENATGAGGTIATARASARAEPDGYTILIHHIGISTAATL